MPTLPQLLTLLAFLYILLLNQTCHQKATVVQQWCGCILNILQSLKSLQIYFCCRGRQKYFHDENIPLSLNGYCVSGF